MPTETKGSPTGARSGLSPSYGNRRLLGEWGPVTDFLIDRSLVKSCELCETHHVSLNLPTRNWCRLLY